MAAVVAGPADLHIRTQKRARFADVAVGLAEVEAVGTEALGKRHAVVDDERHLIIGADSLQRFGEAGELVLFDVLHAQLKGARDPRLQGRAEPVGEAPADILRADQIEVATLGPARRE